MISLPLSKIAEITGGAVVAHPATAAAETMVTGPVVIDSRAVRPGSLFVALLGERVDGHDFAAAAVAAGAAGVLTDRAPDGAEPFPAVVVENVVQALGRLARWVLAQRPGIAVVGVTGSAGKTSTKDLIAQVLSRHGPTVAPAGSFNNEIGHPLTVLGVDDETAHLVLEMGARGLGHIAYLSHIAPPRIGVVLNVGTAHIGEFGSRDVVAKAKGELVEAVPGTGTAILNADDPLVRTMAARTPAKIVLFGRAPDAMVRATDEWLDERGRARFSLVTPEGTLPVALRLHGSHAVANALAAAAVAREAGMELHEIAEALSEAGPVSRWRMEITERPDGVTVVNDAYNANPESMRAALDTVAHLTAGAGPDGRRGFAVLGEMAELGASAVAEHEKIGQHVARSGFAGLIVVGAPAAPMLEGARQVASWTGECVQVDDVGAAVTALSERLRPRDVVLVKGSRVAGMERVAFGLLDGGAQA